MNDIVSELKKWMKTGGVSVQLIFINVAVFLIFAIINNLMPKFLGQTLPVPVNFSWLAVVNSPLAELGKIWTYFSYQFLHASFGHLFFNMIGLFIFGRILNMYTTSKRMLGTYLLSGVAGGLLFGLVGYAAGATGPLVGASGSVMGIMGAAIAHNPRLEFNLIIVKVPFLLIGIVYLLGDISTVASFSNNWGGSLAHIGGVLFGFVSVTLYKNGTDIIGWFTKITDRIAGAFNGKKKPKSKLKVKYSKQRTAPGEYKKPISDDQYNSEKKNRQDIVDAILDKIKRSGYESLSKKEKDFLFNEGKKL